MTEAPRPFSVRRILVAFHPSTASRAAVEGAVEWAARLEAELEALFVEDVNVLRLAELPFVRQVSLHGATGQPANMELELRALAAQAERRLAEAAGRRRIRWSFKTARGHLEQEVTTAAGQVDLLILESSSRPIGREMRLEAPVRMMIAKTAASVLLLQPERSSAGPVHVLLEAGTNLQRTIQAAADLARRHAVPLEVTVFAAEAEQRRRLLHEAQAQLIGQPMPVRHRSMTGTGAAELQGVVDAVAHGTLVLDASSRLLEPDLAWELVAKAPCAVLLVR